MRVLGAALLGLVAALAMASLAEGAEPPISVGPNILVSREGDVPHVELIVATNPKAAKNIVGAAITATRPVGGWACRTYASTDGGTTWSVSPFAQQIAAGGGDPYVAFTPQGTAIFTALSFVQDENHRTRAALHAYRSEDGGVTWQKPADLGYSFDHEQMTVDLTKGKYAGRIYLGVETIVDYPIYRVRMFRSEDDGRTWIGPVEVASGGGTIGINDVTPMVLSDGTVVVPYGDYPFQPDKRPIKGFGSSTYWIATSTDGGVTFASPLKVQEQQYNLDDKETPLAGFGKFAADTESKKYLDRMYFAWEDSHLGPYRIFFSRSSDRGKTWSAPRAIDNGIPRIAEQYQPAIVVNKDGVVAVTWFDTRGSADGKRYEQYFAASVDGGETFLPSAKVSLDLSNPRGRGNSQMSPEIFVEDGDLGLSFLSAASRWASGGDYMGLAADKDGVFHPFWADARTGTFQVYTARVKVDLPAQVQSGSAPPPAKPVRAEPARIESSLLGRVEFIFDPSRYDPDTKQLEVPVRLRNVSGAAIYPPIRVEVIGFGFPKYENEDDRKRNAENAPAALNASNGKAKEGAVFEFGGTLGSAEALEPGAQTNPLLMRFQFVDAEKAPNLRLKAVGMISVAP